MRFLGKNPIFRSDRVFLTLFISREKKNRIRLFSWAFWHFFEKWPFFLPPFLRFLTFFSKIRAKKRPFWGALKNREKSAKIWCFFRTVLPLGKPLFLGGSAVPTFQKNGCFWPPPPHFSEFNRNYWTFLTVFCVFSLFFGGSSGRAFFAKKTRKKGGFWGGPKYPPFWGGGEGGSREKVRFENEILPLGPKRGFPLWKGRKWGFLDPIRLGKGLFWPFLAFSPYPPPTPPLFGPFLTFFSALNPFWHSPRWKDAPPHREAFKSKYTWTLEW